jgi:hypothetical protein
VQVHAKARLIARMTYDTPSTAPLDPAAREAWLNAFVPLGEVARLRGVSKDTVKRTDARERALTGRSRLVRISKRLLGMRRRHALLLDE